IFSGSKVDRPAIKYEFFEQPIRTAGITDRDKIREIEGQAISFKKQTMIDVIKQKIRENPEKKEYFQDFYRKYRKEEIDKIISKEISTRDNNFVYDEISLDRPNNPEEVLKLYLDRINIKPELILSEKQIALTEYLTSFIKDPESIKEINKLCKEEFVMARDYYIQGKYQEAFEIFSKLTEKYSHGFSHIFLGEMYYTGSTGIVKQDFNMAFEHFTKASHFRIPVAFGMLGELTYKGLAEPNIKLVAKDINDNIVNEEIEDDNDNEEEEEEDKNLYTFPMVYFNIASDLNLKSSIEQLVFIYMKLNNVHGAVHHLKRLASKHNDINACTTIGTLLLEDHDNFSKNILLFASKMGDTNAQTHLGRYYYNCKNPDYKNSFLLWESAALEGNADAQFYLGGMYQQGLIVERSSKKAFEFYEKSARGGNSNSQFLIGKAYYEGEELPKNEKLGLQFITKSSHSKNELAIEYLNNI
ncbi:hypothetical protein DICPUDRAFT_6769, partial [Dictyostelium purpureum]